MCHQLRTPLCGGYVSRFPQLSLDESLYYGMWLILRVKGGKCRSEAMTLPFRHILFVGGAGVKPLRHGTVQYI